MMEWRLDCENCSHLTVVDLHDTGPWCKRVTAGADCPGGSHQKLNKQTATNPYTFIEKWNKSTSSQSRNINCYHDITDLMHSLWWDYWLYAFLNVSDMSPKSGCFVPQGRFDDRVCCFKVYRDKTLYSPFFISDTCSLCESLLSSTTTTPTTWAGELALPLALPPFQGLMWMCSCCALVVSGCLWSECSCRSVLLKAWRTTCLLWLCFLRTSLCASLATRMGGGVSSFPILAEKTKRHVVACQKSAWRQFIFHLSSFSFFWWLMATLDVSLNFCQTSSFNLCSSDLSCDSSIILFHHDVPPPPSSPSSLFPSIVTKCPVTHILFATSLNYFVEVLRYQYFTYLFGGRVRVFWMWWLASVKWKSCPECWWCAQEIAVSVVHKATASLILSSHQLICILKAKFIAPQIIWIMV